MMQHILNHFCVVFRLDISKENSWHPIHPKAFSLYSEELSDLRTHHTSYLSFALLSPGNLSFTYLNDGLACSVAFKKFFIRSSFMYRGCCVILCVSTIAGCCTLYSITFQTSFQASFSSQSSTSLLGCPTQTERSTTYITTADHQHCHYLKSITEIPAVPDVMKTVQQMCKSQHLPLWSFKSWGRWPQHPQQVVSAPCCSCQERQRKRICLSTLENRYPFLAGFTDLLDDIFWTAHPWVASI